MPAPRPGSLGAPYCNGRSVIGRRSGRPAAGSNVISFIKLSARHRNAKGFRRCDFVMTYVKKMSPADKPMHVAGPDPARPRGGTVYPTGQAALERRWTVVRNGTRAAKRDGEEGRTRTHAQRHFYCKDFQVHACSSSPCVLEGACAVACAMYQCAGVPMY